MKRDGNPARVLFVSAEMGETEMMCRLVALCGEMHLGTAKTILYGRAHGGTLDAYGWKFEQGALRVKELPLRMIFGCFDADGLKDVAARYSGRFDVFVIDYLQRVVRKQRNGPLDVVNFEFDLPVGRIWESGNGEF